MASSVDNILIIQQDKKNRKQAIVDVLARDMFNGDNPYPDKFYMKHGDTGRLEWVFVGEESEDFGTGEDSEAKEARSKAKECRQFVKELFDERGWIVPRKYSRFKASTIRRGATYSCVCIGCQYV